MKKFLAMLALGVTLSTAGMAQSLSRYQIRVINQSSHVITSIYARNLATDRVYGDLLGNGVLNPESITTFNLNDSSGTCMWRLEADTAEGQVVSRTLDVCRTTSWTLND